jgi:hypothetical protein
MLTHFSAGLAGMFDIDMQNHLGTTGSALIGQDAYARPEGSYSWFIAPAHKLSDVLGIANVDEVLFGSALHDFVRRAAKGLGSITAVGEQAPRAENRLILSGTKDAYGLPIARWDNARDNARRGASRLKGRRSRSALGLRAMGLPAHCRWVTHGCRTRRLSLRFVRSMS